MSADPQTLRCGLALLDNDASDALQDLICAHNEQVDDAQSQNVPD